MDQPTIPRFGSFKPKAAAGPVKSSRRLNGVDSDESVSTSAIAERSSDSHRRDRSSKLSGSHRDRRSHGHDNGSRLERSPYGRQSSYTKSQVDAETSAFFMIDRRGDTENVQYSSLHRYSIPPYSRSGYGSLIGITPGVKLDRDAGTEVGAVLRRNRRHDGDRARRMLIDQTWKGEPKLRKFSKPATPVSALDLAADYVELAPNSKTRDTPAHLNDKLPDLDYKYSNLQPKKDVGPNQEGIQSSSDSESLCENDVVQPKPSKSTFTLLQGTKTNPQDAGAWLAYIDHQAEIVFPDVSPTDLNTSQRISLARVRLPLCDQAFKHIPMGSDGCERLLATWLREGRLIWDFTTLAKQWRGVLENQSRSMNLWMAFLRIMQADHRHFEYEACKQAYLQCLSKIHASCNPEAPERCKSQISRTQVTVLLHLTILIEETGYDELSYAIWQMTLEYYLCRPDSPIGRTARLESLEDFWESDVPRIGEDGSQGWDAFVVGRESKMRQSTATTVETGEGRRSLLRAALEEADVLKMFHLPATTSAPGGVDDPYAHVMFSDLRPILECVPDDLAWQLLLNGFLSFMNLPSLPPSATEAGELVRPSECFVKGRSDVHSNHISASFFDSTSTRAVLNTQQTTTFSLFYFAFDPISANPGLASKSFDPEMSLFIHRVLESLAFRRVSDDQLAEYLIAFKLRFFPGEAPKAAKRLLKARPDSPRLYNAYALLMSRLGSLDKAREIWTTALNMLETFKGSAREDGILLQHSFALTHITLGYETDALQCLISIAEPGPFKLAKEYTIAASQTLRAIHACEAGIEEMQMKDRPTQLVLYAECLAWIYYLVEDGALATAMASFQQIADRLEGCCQSKALELLHEARATMVKLHIGKQRPYRMMTLRDQMLTSMRMFPYNSLITETYYSFGSRSRVDEHLRNAVHESLSGVLPYGLLQSVFAVERETKRFERMSISGSTENSVRSLFNRLLNNPESEVRNSPELWMRWLKFELRLGNDAENNHGVQSFKHVQNVFHNGLQAIPWHKVWLVNGVAILLRCGGMTEADAERIWNMMTERGLRSRVNVSDRT